MSIENGDLDLKASFGFVCYGKFRDFIGIRQMIREQFPDTRIIFPQIAMQHQYLLKRSELTEEQIQKLEEKMKKHGEIGWSFVVKLIIGLLLLAVLMYTAARAKGGFSELFRTIYDLFS